MARVPIVEPDVSNLPGADVRTPHATGDTFGEQIGIAQAGAGKAIEAGLNSLGSALSQQSDEQDAIKSKVALSDHEVAVNQETTRLQLTTPAESQSSIPGSVNEFAQNDWATRRDAVGGKYQPQADAAAHVFWNNTYLKNQQNAVKNYGDAVNTQITNEVQRQGSLVFADPGNVTSATGAIRAYVDELHIPLELKRGALVSAADHFQAQVMAGYTVRFEAANNAGNFAQAAQIMADKQKAMVSLPGQLTHALGIDALPKPIAPPIMLPGQPLPMPGSVRSPLQKTSTGVDQDKPTIPQDSYKAANANLNLNPQEQDLYQRHLTNLYTASGVDNSNGARSTLLATTMGGDDGKTYLVPTVWDGRLLSPDQAMARAKNEGLSKFPAYGSPAEAEARFTQMHDYMDKDTAGFQNYRAQLGRNALTPVTGSFTGGGKYGPQYTPAAIDNASRPKRIGGDMAVEGQHYTFGSGGGGFASIPYGTYPVTPEAIGSWGQAHGAMGLNYNRIWDPSLNRFREGIELHAGSGSQPITQGCVAIAGGEYPKFKSQVQGMIAKYGKVFLSVGPSGATITPTPAGKIDTASLKQQQFVSLKNPTPLSTFDTRYATTGGP